MAGIQDEDLAEMMSMKGGSVQQQGERSTPFYNLKREFESYEKELQETVSDYESSLFHDILTSTRQRIKLLEVNKQPSRSQLLFDHYFEVFRANNEFLRSLTMPAKTALLLANFATKLTMLRRRSGWQSL